MSNWQANPWVIAISSALISAFVGFIVGMKREKIILRQRLETETVDELLRLIKEAMEKVGGMDTVFFHLPFNRYNDLFDEKEDPAEGNIKNILLSGQIDLMKGNIDDLVAAFLRYFDCAVDLIRFSESRSIILNGGFKIFIDRIIEYHGQLRENENLLVEQICRFTILPYVDDHERIPQNYLDMIKEQLKNLESIKLDLVCVYRDFEIELQNEFIGKYYPKGKKLAPRCPEDPSCRVLRKDKTVKW